MAAQTLHIGGDRYTVRTVLREDFQDLSHWRQLEDHGRWHVENGGLIGEWVRESPSLFLRQKIEGDFIWQVRASRVVPDEAFLQRFSANRHAAGADPLYKYNFNFWLRVDVPQEVSGFGVQGSALDVGRSTLDVGRSEPRDETFNPSTSSGQAVQRSTPNVQQVQDFWEAYPRKLGTGWNGMGDDYWNSLFTTVVWNPDGSWVRLRRSPGYRMERDCQDALPHLGYGEPHEFTFAVGRGRVRMYYDGRRVYEYAAEGLPESGYVGLCVWLCVIRFEQMRIYQWV